MRIALEGVTGSGKTTLFHKLQGFRTRNGTQFFLSQFHVLATTEAYPQDLRAKKAYEMCTCILDFIEKSEELWQSSGIEQHSQRASQARLEWTMETFHVDLYMRSHLTHNEFRSLDRRLHRLNHQLVVLTLPEEHIYHRCVFSTKVHRGERWQTYLNNIGATEEQLTSAFIKKQRRILEIVDESTLPRMVIDTTEMQWDSHTQTIQKHASSPNPRV